MDIFISYSWENKDISDKFEVLFKSSGIILKRDIRNINYKESIKEFMKKIRNMDFCLMIISDSFLKSKNCMFEILEFIKDENYKNRILPIICKNTKIFNASERADYILFWQAEYNNINNIRENINPLNQGDIINDLKIIENIQRNITEFLSCISDMKLITVNSDISYRQYIEIYKIINPSLDIEDKYVDVGGFFVMNVQRTREEGVCKWWQLESAGYVNDINDAKIFLKNDVNDFFNLSEYPKWEEKKYAAIPIQTILSIGINVIPFIQEYIDIIRKDMNKIYGNKRLYLTDEEMEEYK